MKRYPESISRVLERFTREIALEYLEKTEESDIDLVAISRDFTRLTAPEQWELPGKASLALR